MDEWYLIRSDDHDMDKDLVITAEIMDAVMDMASVMVTCRISVQDPMKNLAPDQHTLGCHFTRGGYKRKYQTYVQLFLRP